MAQYSYPHIFTKHNIEVEFSIVGYDPTNPIYVNLWEKAKKHLPVWEKGLEKFLDAYHERSWVQKPSVWVQLRQLPKSLLALLKRPAPKKLEVFIIRPEDIKKLGPEKQKVITDSAERGLVFFAVWDVNDATGAGEVYLRDKVVEFLPIESKYILIHELLHLIQRPNSEQITMQMVGPITSHIADVVGALPQEAQLSGFYGLVHNIIADIIVDKMYFRLVGNEYRDVIIYNDAVMKRQAGRAVQTLPYFLINIARRCIFFGELNRGARRRFEGATRKVEERGALPSFDLDKIRDAVAMLEDGCDEHAIKGAAAKLLEVIPFPTFLKFKETFFDF